MPGWALTAIFAVGLAALVTGGYFTYKRYAPAQGLRAAIEFQKVPDAAEAAPVESRLARHIQVTGLRLTEDAGRKLEVRFVVVNHSGAQLNDVTGTVALRPEKAAPGDPHLGTFTFQVPSLGPYESRELTASVDTRLRAYELPDWQNLRPDVRITSP